MDKIWIWVKQCPLVPTVQHLQPWPFDGTDCGTSVLTPVTQTHQLGPPRRVPALRCSLCWWAGKTGRSCPSCSLSTKLRVSLARYTEEREGHFYPLQSLPGIWQVDRLLYQISLISLAEEIEAPGSDWYNSRITSITGVCDIWHSKK